VRRGFIAERYAELIEALYSGMTSPTIDARVRFEDGRVGQIRADVLIREAQTYPRALLRRTLRVIPGRGSDA
jgi:long-chain acyl-CoA synthetase